MIKERVLLLNHHGLGEFLMSLPACRWLVGAERHDVWITIAGPEEEICRNQRCGSRFVPFSVSRRHPLKAIELVLKIRQLRIDTVVALYGFEPRMVKRFSGLIGAKRWLCHSECETEMFDRNSVHKRYRHLKIISEILGQPVPDGQGNDYLLDDLPMSAARPLAGVGRYIVLVPGSGEMECFKRWPLREFIAFSRSFLKLFPEKRILITGTRAEAALGNAIEKDVDDPRIINMCGELSLRQLVDAFHESDLVIGGDCGGLHLAKAAAARVAVIMGPTNSALTGPIEADLVLDKQMPGTPWYCRRTLKAKGYSAEEPSMQIPASVVLEAALARGFFEYR